jgi:transcription-repair coupling factor (superfamily II helicase)
LMFLATTIIESGLDVLMPIRFSHNANNFGLSDLHQMRGREANKKALLFYLSAVFSNDWWCRKRIQALEQFSDLGRL